MIGKLIAPTSVKITAARAASDESSTARHSAIKPRYIKNRISTEVSRASHTHHVPHIGRPHSEPVARQTKVNAAPIGAADRAATSASGCRQTSATALATATNR